MRTLLNSETWEDSNNEYIDVRVFSCPGTTQKVEYLHLLYFELTKWFGKMFACFLMLSQSGMAGTCCAIMPDTVYKYIDYDLRIIKDIC